MGADPSSTLANAIPPTTINFRDLFLVQEEEDEESASLGDALAALAAKWPGADKFKSTDIAKLINNRSEYQIDTDKQCASVLREFLFPRLPEGQDVTAISLGKALKRHIGEPVTTGDRTLILKDWRDPHDGTKGALSYFVHVADKPPCRG
jgi:hypothetical protein